MLDVLEPVTEDNSEGKNNRRITRKFQQLPSGRVRRRKHSKQRGWNTHMRLDSAEVERLRAKRRYSAKHQIRRDLMEHLIEE